MAKQDGILQLKDSKVEAYPLPVGGQINPNTLLRDRQGGLWIGTGGQGLLHLHQGRADVFTSADGLSGDAVQCFFEDREGNIWAATREGLDRFRDFAVPTISVKQGLSNGIVGSVLAARDGSVWLGTADGLNRWNTGQITIYRKRSGGPLTRLAQLPGVREIFDDGLPRNSAESLFQDERGRIWVPTGSKWKSTMIRVSSGCECGTMERALTRKCWKPGARDTTVWPACKSAPGWWG
jgi:ligand-binding sensor domain-containing protein